MSEHAIAAAMAVSMGRPARRSTPAATSAGMSMSRARNAATTALAELRSVCQSCHGEFREETDDGFRIKPDALK